MITMDEAKARCDARIRPLALEYRPASDSVLLCAGTDVPGPALNEEIKKTMAEFAIGGGSEVEVIARLYGLLARTFWLGYAFGEEAER